MTKLKRVYHHYLDWEEIDHNMWGYVEDINGWIDKAVKFTGDHNLYGGFMMRVIKEWPISCENALTDNKINRKAWIGHAAVALAIECPEHIVRLAWGKLTDEQRKLANEQADRAIRTWEDNYIKSNDLHSGMEGAMLF